MFCGMYSLLDVTPRFLSGPFLACPRTRSLCSSRTGADSSVYLNISKAFKQWSKDSLTACELLFVAFLLLITASFAPSHLVLWGQPLSLLRMPVVRLNPVSGEQPMEKCFHFLWNKAKKEERNVGLLGNFAFLAEFWFQCSIFLKFAPVLLRYIWEKIGCRFKVDRVVIW